MYQFCADVYTLLDSGILFQGIMKAALASLAFHVLVKLAPRRRRLLVMFLLAPIVLVFFRISLTQDMIGGYEALGRSQAEIRNDEAALRHYLQAASWGPTSPRVSSWLLRHYCSKNQWQEVEQLASTSRQRYPSDPEVLTTIGEILLYRGDFAQAALIGEKLSSSHEMFFWMKGFDLWARALIKLNRPLEAAQVLRQQIGRVPSPEVRSVLEREIRLLTLPIAGGPHESEDKK
jgi:tetratricopeptide (TPR) repeat protein